MIFPKLGHSGFGSGLKIKNKEETNKKKAIMYGNVLGLSLAVGPLGF